MKYLMLLIFLTGCSSNNAGPTTCERELKICELNLAIERGVK